MHTFFFEIKILQYMQYMYRSIKSGIPLVYSSTETKSDIALSYIPPSNCNCVLLIIP